MNRKQKRALRVKGVESDPEKEMRRMFKGILPTSARVTLDGIAASRRMDGRCPTYRDPQARKKARARRALASSFLTS